MVIFVAMLVILCLWGIKINFRSGFEDYMSPQKTGSVKGIFVVIVLLSHMRQYITVDNSWWNKPFNDFLGPIGQLMVVAFLFYSGYGIALGLKTKDGYAKTLPTKRALKVLIHFDIAVLIFYITGLALGKDYSVKKLLFSLVGLDGVGNSIWFIFDIIILYLLTFAVFIFAKKKMIVGTTVMTVVSFVAVLLIKEFKGNEYWWWDTVMCYPLGMWFALAKPYFDKNILPSFWKWILTTAVSVGAFVFLKEMFVQNGYERWFFVGYALVFAIITVLVSMRISINNKVLQWFGKRVFGIYILQRIPMMILSHFGANRNPVLFAAVSFALTIVLAEVFERAMDKLDVLLHLSKKPIANKMKILQR